ncbi:MAG TPA: cation diffusion facilitator family transporter [Candidatus Margulisiibacteriota bacterium]|nr:cation diffusion facilitator family transporter [Candidatus Margulisiibacteriota bacterium]
MLNLKSNSNTAFSNEKQWAAASSAVAALGLTVFKVVVGIITGSLGILAEALHSGLDLLAALITVFAINKSSKPADREHPYGHGKAENISAFFETALLLITCFWIISAAIRRISSGRLEIEVNIWSFIVMFISIAIDLSRSRMLYRAARKFNSQALEADALHFSTDIWSSAVVILGLFCVKISEWFKGYEFLHYSDAVAAIIVALIVVKISIKLGNRTIQALLDSAPPGLDEKIIATVKVLPNIIDCHNVRVRSLGHQCFIDLHINVNGNLTLRKVHSLTEEIERVIKEFVPNADITVHPEPKE